MKFPWTKALEKRVAEATAAQSQQNSELRGKLDAVERALSGMMQPIGYAPTQTRRPIYSLDTPIIFTTPNSPKRKPLSLGSTDDLRRIADTWDILRTPIEHLKREVRSTPVLVQARDTRDDSKQTAQRIHEASQFFTTAGGNGEFGKPRATFETEWLEDLLVIGCYAIFRHYKYGGTLHNQICIDASTIRPRVDVYGWPDDEVAYEQWIYGTVVGHFSKDEIFYDGINSRSNVPYYRSPIEWLMAPIVSGMAEDEWNRTFFTDGTAPGDDIFTLPAELTSDQIKVYTEIFDEMLQGNTLERRKTRYLPNGSERLSTGTRREHDFQEFEMWVLRRVWALYGVAPSACGFAGEQYKVSQEGSNEQTTQFGAGALLAKRKEFYDDTLVRLGYGDLEINDPTLRIEIELDDVQRANLMYAGGLASLNEARKVIALEPVQGGDERKEMANQADNENPDEKTKTED